MPATSSHSCRAGHTACAENDARYPLLMPDPRDMSDEALRTQYEASSRNSHDTGVKALLREMDRRSRTAQPVMKYLPWSADDDAMLMRLFREDTLIPAIASQIGRTEESTRTRIRRLKARMNV